MLVNYMKNFEVCYGSDRKVKKYKCDISKQISKCDFLKVVNNKWDWNK